MGVFAVFRRKKKDVVEASSEETGAVVTSTAGAADATGTDAMAEAAADADVDVVVAADVPFDDGDDDVVVVAAEAVEAPEAGAADPVDDVDGVDGSADVDAVEGVGADERAAGAVAPEVVEIPKQQSAEAAADNEAGESARK